MKTKNTIWTILLSLTVMTVNAQLKVFNTGTVRAGNAALNQTGTVLVDGYRPVIINGADEGITKQGNSGGWAFGFHAKGSSGTNRGGFGFLGSADNLTYYYIGNSYSSPVMVAEPIGEVGIGTTTPNAVLDIYRSSATSLLSDGIKVHRPGQYGTFAFMTQFGSIAYFGSYYPTSGVYGQIRFRQYGPSGTNDALCISTSGEVSIGTTVENGFKFNVFGTTYCSSGSWSGSDLRFKKNVQPIQNALEKVMKLNGKSYEFKVEEFPEFHFNETTNYGFVAQELLEVLPEAVKLDSSEHYSVNYDMIIPVLAEAIKEQNKRIDSLMTQTLKQDSINQVLQALISNCCITNIQGLRINNDDELNGTGNLYGTTGINDSNLGIKSNTVPILYQNNPNPFNNQTNINYFIPSTAQSASIMLFDLQGKLVKTLPVANFNHGSITINGYELNAGMFVYSLIVDGKIVDTKNMILTQ